MKQALHIFKKDVRHLWPQILLTLAVVAALGREDRWRSDGLAGATEGWLNLLLPVTWAFLIGLAVGQEPLAGHRQFWITRPYRRWSLLVAKLLFAAAFVHLPFLFEQVFVLGARGFSPAAHLPELLWNQAALFAALTLPAMALAALAGTFTQFVMEVVAAAVAMVFLRSTFDTSRVPWEGVETVRLGATVLVVAAASVAVACLQYFGRKLLVSRGVGVGAGIAAGVVFAVLLPPSAFALKSAMVPLHRPLDFRIREGGPQWTASLGAPNRSVVSVPVELAGMSAGTLYHLETLASTIQGPAGVKYAAATRGSYQSFERITFENNYITDAAIGPNRSVYRDASSGRGWLWLRFDPSLFDRLKNGEVEITGEVGVTAYRLGETTWMSPDSAAYTPLNGRCAATTVEDRYSEGMLKVECESPSTIPMPTRVRVWHPESGQSWNEMMGSSSPYVSGPRSTWLSALDRRQTYFRLTDEPSRPGSMWMVPRSAVATAKIAITPEVVTGYSVVKYDIKKVTLSKYWVPTIRR